MVVECGILKIKTTFRGLNRTSVAVDDSGDASTTYQFNLGPTLIHLCAFGGDTL